MFVLGRFVKLALDFFELSNHLFAFEFGEHEIVIKLLWSLG